MVPSNNANAAVIKASRWGCYLPEVSFFWLRDFSHVTVKLKPSDSCCVRCCENGLLFNPEPQANVSKLSPPPAGKGDGSAHGAQSTHPEPGSRPLV